MTHWLHVVVDDRGRSRHLLEAWTRSLAVEHIWFVDFDEPQARPDGLRPTECDISHWDLVALLHEPRPDDEPHVLCVFPSLVSFNHALRAGCRIEEATVLHRQAGDVRLASHVHLDENGVDALRQAYQHGVQLFAQPLPNITARSLRPPEVNG